MTIEQLLDIKDAIVEYRLWFDTMSKVNVANAKFKAEAASKMVDNALNLIDVEMVIVSANPTEK